MTKAACPRTSQNKPAIAMAVGIISAFIRAYEVTVTKIAPTTCRELKAINKLHTEMNKSSPVAATAGTEVVIGLVRLRAAAALNNMNNR